MHSSYPQKYEGLELESLTQHSLNSVMYKYSKTSVRCVGVSTPTVNGCSKSRFCGGGREALWRHVWKMDAFDERLVLSKKWLQKQDVTMFK